MAEILDEYIITITGDASGLQPTIDTLEELEAVDKKTAAAFNSTTKDIENQSKAFGNVAKNIESGNQKIQGTAKNVSTLASAFKDLTKNIPATALNALSKDVLAGVQDALDEAGISSDEFLKKLTGGVDNVEPKAQTLKSQLRGMKEELNQLELAGKDNTQEFLNLAVAAAKLEDQIGDTQQRIRLLADDSKNIKVAIEGLQGIVAAYSIAQGTQALFGSDSKQLQETLVKLNGVMAILNSLTTINQLIQKQSLLYTQLTVIQKRAEAVATNLQTASESKNIVIRYAAVVAQKALNAVMAASPAGILITVFAGLAAAMVYLSGKTNEVNDELSKSNQLLSTSVQANKFAIDAIKKRAEATEDSLQHEKELLQANGSTREEIAAKEAQIDQERVNNAKATTRVLVQTYGDLSSKTTDLTNELFKYELAVSEAGDADKALIDGKKVDIKLANDKISLLKSEISTIKSVQDADTEATNTLIANNLRRQNDANRDRLQAIIDTTNTELQLVDKNSQREFELRRKLINDESALAQQQDGITAEKRAFIIAETNKKLEDLDRQHLQKLLENEKANLQSRVDKVKEGSTEELALRIQIIEKEKQISLSAEGLLQGERKKIIADSEKQIIELRRKTAFESFNTARTIISDDIKTRLAAVQEGTFEEFKLKQDLIDSESHAEKLQLAETIKDEKLLQSEIQRIDAETTRKKLDAEKTFQRERLRIATDSKLALIDLETSKLNPDDPNLTIRQRQQLNQKIIENEKRKNIELQRENADAYMRDLESKEEFEAKKNSLEEKYNKLSQQESNDAAAIKISNQKVVEEFVLNSISSISQAATSALLEQIQAEEQVELASLEKRKDQELSNTKLTKSQQAAIEEKYRKQESDIKTKSAKRQRDAEVTQAEINGLLSVTSILASFKDFGSPIAVAAAIATALLTTGLQIKAIKAKPLPVFHHGVDKITHDFNRTKHVWDNRTLLNSDEVLAILQTGEGIFDRKTNKDYFPALSAIRSRKVTPEVANMLLSGINVKKNYVTRNVNERVDKVVRESIGIDYSMLAQYLQFDYKKLAYYIGVNQGSTDISNESIKKLAKAIQPTTDHRRS